MSFKHFFFKQQIVNLLYFLINNKKLFEKKKGGIFSWEETGCLDLDWFFLRKIYLHFFFFLSFILLLLLLLFFYFIVLVLPYIYMNPPWVYTSSPFWTPLPPPSPYHPPGSSQCTHGKFHSVLSVIIIIIMIVICLVWDLSNTL